MTTRLPVRRDGRLLVIKRLVVGHGEIIEDAPLAQLVEAWRLVGVDVARPRDRADRA